MLLHTYLTGTQTNAPTHITHRYPNYCSYTHTPQVPKLLPLHTYPTHIPHRYPNYCSYTHTPQVPKLLLLHTYPTGTQTTAPTHIPTGTQTTATANSNSQETAIFEMPCELRLILVVVFVTDKCLCFRSQRTSVGWRQSSPSRD